MKKRITSKRPLTHYDGFENVLSGKGSSVSKSGANTYTSSCKLPYTKIRDIYKSGGIGAKVITRVADDITRKGFTIKNDTNGGIRKSFDKLKALSKFNRAIRWARAYGGAIITIIAQDGKPLTEPLNPKAVRKVERLDVWEAGISNRVTVHEYYTDPTQEDYGIPKIYCVNKHHGGEPLYIHESRCIRIDGRPYDTAMQYANNGWDGSELEPVYDALISMYSAMMSGEQVLDEMVIGTLKIDNLDAMCADEEGESRLRKRLDLVDKSKSNENTIAIDINEEYERHTVNLSGMSNIQHNAMLVVAGSSDIPATFLFGSSPDGQNATGDSDKEQYYGKIEAEREYLLKPALLRLLEILSGRDDLIVAFPAMRVSTLFDTARSIDSLSKSLIGMVTGGILSTSEAKAMFMQTNLIDKISILE